MAVFICAAPVRGQSYQEIWSEVINGTYILELADMAVDDDGNVYVVGSFQTRMVFGSSIWHVLNSAGEYDIFIAKYTSDGSVVWAQGIGTLSNEMASGVTIDGQGNIIVAGIYDGILGELLTMGGYDMFVLKLDPDGNTIWFRRWGTSEVDFVADVAVGPNDEISIAGFSWDAGISWPASKNIAVASLTTDGEWRWSNVYPFPEYQQAIWVGFSPGGSTIVSGQIFGVVDLGGGPFETQPMGDDGFLLELDGDGIHVWSAHLEARPAAFGVDGNGEIVFAQYFWDEGLYLSDQIPPFTYCLVRLTSTHDLRWYADLGLSYYNTRDLAVGDDGSAALIGGGGANIFVVEYRDDGQMALSAEYLSSDGVSGKRIVAGPGGERYLGGLLWGSIDFGGGPISSTGIQADIFMVMLQGQVSGAHLPAAGEMVTVHQNTPNPFNPQTTIAFEIPERQAVTLRVFDMSGRLVRELITAEPHTPGRHEVVWNGRDESGLKVASGVYFYRLDVGSFWETKRLVLVK